MEPYFSKDFQDWILDSIPLLRAMELKFDHYTPGELIMSCPLAPNINDKGTGFGGSIGTLATICGWTFTMIEARATEPEAEALVAEHHMKFLTPATGDLIAVCKATVPDSFQQKLASKRVAKLELSIDIQSGGKIVATFNGIYVARRSSAS
ncbi:MAG: YiiD C-terminal domain-containing protein [Endozoicomonas sp.]